MANRPPAIVGDFISLGRGEERKGGRKGGKRRGGEDGREDGEERRGKGVRAIRRKGTAGEQRRKRREDEK